MSEVIDPKSVDNKINYVMRVSASPVVTPSRLGFLLRRESRKVVVRDLAC